MNDKHETSRFGGEGQCFKAKLIGILEVPEARGDRMCQDALCDLKMAIRAAGEHKQRITIHVALDGLRLRDEKTGDCLFHHPVHKISFIAQDMTDSRAFGYIFGSPEIGHKFFGIKTDKAASQVVIAMRDLFQVVFTMKKKEIELAKQHLEKNCLYNSPLFSDSSSTKSVTPELPTKYEAIKNECKSLNLAETKNSGTAVANLVDLQLELNSLQQGLHQMEKITPSETFSFKDDPFGDSFTSFPNPILPPPPSSGRDRNARSSDSSSIFSPKTPHTGDSSVISSFESYPFTALPKTDFKISSSHEEPSSGEWFTPSNSLADEASLPPEITQQILGKNENLEQTTKEILSQFDVFTELDPLELKNPPKKALNDLVSINQSENKDTDVKISGTSKSVAMAGFDSDPFGEDPFVSLDPFAEAELKQDPFDQGFIDQRNANMLLSTSLSKSPNATILLEASPRSVKFDNEDKIPEPPPRHEVGILQIKPPPLPPKKQQTADLMKQPPLPRISNSEDSIYDYMDRYETVKTAVDVEKSPALPIPMRKTKFSDFSVTPQRPAKLSTATAYSFEDDYYLTPVRVNKDVQFQIDTQGNDPSLDGLDVSLSKLTLSGLNELATKLDIPPARLSNMTLVELTSYLSNVVKSKKATSTDCGIKTVKTVEETSSALEFPTFKADFESNFGQPTLSSMSSTNAFDRYAVFRELINEEIKQTKIDSEPGEIQGEVDRMEVNEEKPNTPQEISREDRYAALREIVEEQLFNTENKIEASKEIQEAGNGDRSTKTDEATKPTVKPTSVFKSPIPDAIQNNSGSLSDIVSGSSPEADKSDPLPKESDVGESWAMFDRKPVIEEEEKHHQQQQHQQQNQSEEGQSPWSSDSNKEGNGSPPSDYKPGGDSESGGDQWIRKKQEGWWDTSAEPDGSRYLDVRRSTDSYEEEYYECYDRPRRRRQGGGWSGAGHTSSQGEGGHSSSSRDVSPWEEEPKRRERIAYARSKHRERRHTDSWDEEDDYGYSDNRRFHDSRERWEDEWSEDRRRWRRDRDHRCCPDWTEEDHDKPPIRYGSGRWSSAGTSPGKWRERYYNRDLPPWEGEYPFEEDPHSHYVASKRNWKRPNSASEMERKSGEAKQRHLAGSDGERERRYKNNRRSRSRDSQYSDSYRHKPEVGSLNRTGYKSKPHSQYAKPPFETEFLEKKLDADLNSKKSSILQNRKKKEGPKNDESTNTFPRKSKIKQQSVFEFENNFQTEASPPQQISKLKATTDTQKKSTKDYPLQNRSKSLFEDDFSVEKNDENIPVIREVSEETESFSAISFGNPTSNRFGKRLSVALRADLKKSDSVNIFARENDPFDDEFFCEHSDVFEDNDNDKQDLRNGDRKWTD